MSNEALNWAFGVDCKPAAAKFVLVAMADAAGKAGCSYQAVSTLSMRTNLNRKTVLKSIKTLIKHDLIEDTGEKIGRTKSVIIYRLKMDSGPINGTPKQDHKRDTLEGEAVPFLPPSSTTFTRKQSQNRDTEPKGTQRNPKKKSKKRSQNTFSDGDLKCAKWIFEKVLTLNPNYKKPNIDNWADTIRLMRERDDRTHREIAELYDWVNKDNFWKSVVLCPESLRRQFDKLTTKKQNPISKTPHSGSQSTPKPLDDRLY